MARKERWRFYNSGAGSYWEGHINGSTQEYVSAMEYRYDGPRERYLVRGRNPQDLTLPARVDGTLAVEGGSWHDYDGGIFADWSVDATVNQQTQEVTLRPHERTAQAPGLAQYDYGASSGQEQHYLHGNLIGTTVAVSDQGSGASGGALAGRRVYTAFGEQVDSTGIETRFGYAGAWGDFGDPDDVALQKLGCGCGGQRWGQSARAGACASGSDRGSEKGFSHWQRSGSEKGFLHWQRSGSEKGFLHWRARSGCEKGFAHQRT